MRAPRARWLSSTCFGVDSFDSFGSVQRAAESLSELERKSILNDGPPQRENFTDPSLYQTMVQFHSEVERLQGVNPGINIGGHRA